jgi:hypothetical protein
MAWRWGSGGRAPPHLTLALDGSEWSASHPCCFSSRETVHGMHFIGGWVGPRANLDVIEKGKISLLPARNWTLIPQSPSPYPSYYTHRYWGYLLWVHSEIHCCPCQYCLAMHLFFYAKGKSYPCDRPWRLIWLWDFNAPTFSRQSGCQPYVLATLYPQEYSRYSFLLESELTPYWGWKD